MQTAHAAIDLTGRAAQSEIVKAVRILMAGAVRDQARDQAQLAVAIGMSEPSMSKLMNGHRKMTVDEALAIADHFEVPIGDLYAGREGVLRSRCFSGLALVPGGLGQGELFDGDHPEDLVWPGGRDHLTAIPA